MNSDSQKTRKERIQNSKNFNPETQRFQNRRRAAHEQLEKKEISFGKMIGLMRSVKDAAPSKKLPEIVPDMEVFLAPSNDLKCIWFGHSSILLNMDGKIILVDPVFSGSASPLSFLVKRFQPPVLKISELPKIDIVLLSHDHYDHLDSESIKELASRDLQFITPLGVGERLEKWGIASSRIIEKDWWEELDYEGIKFTCTPAHHFSGRSLHDRNTTLWASWVLKSENHNIYFSGDSGYDIHFTEIGNKLGPFDVAFIESGQYNKLWRDVHMLPADSLQAFFDLKARKYFPIHWGMFILSKHSWYDPMVQLFKLSEGKDVNFVVPKLGELVNLSRPFVNELWWSPVIEVPLKVPVGFRD